MAELFVLSLGTIFITNIVLARFLGICPFLGVSRQVETSIGMGLAVTFVMTLASAITYWIQKGLEHFGIDYLQTIAFILVIAVLVQLVEMVIKKSSPVLYQALGIYLPLITTNCAVMGIAILNIEEHYSFLETVVNGFSGGVSFILAIVLFAGLRERLEYSPVPQSLQGFPIALILAGLLSMAFLGFSGFNLQALFGI